MGDLSPFLYDSNSSSETMTQMAKTFITKNRMSIVQPTAEGTVFQCVECSIKLLDKEKMELHLLLHNKEYRYLCGICGAGLKRKEHLDRHTLGHQEVRPHVCTECGKGFKRKEHLNIHKTIHTGDKSQVCPFCQRSFYRKDHLQKHLVTHNKQFIEVLTENGMMEVKQEFLEEDIKMEMGDPLVIDESSVKYENGAAGTPTSERPYACQYCEKTYKRKDHLKIHSVTHLAKDKVCSECGKAFHKEDQLLCHMNTHLKTKGLGDSSILEDHDSLIPVDHTHIDITPLNDNDLLVALPEREERRHECPICFKRFKRRQHLKVHSNVHTRALQPTIWCSLCSVGFTNNDQFENHVCMPETPAQSSEQPRDTAARKENQPQYNTQQPISESEEVSYIQEHTTSSEGPPEERLIPRPQRVYVCKYCAKPFRRKDHYKIHLHIHTGVKSFFCVDCGKGFYRKDHLQKHALVHYRTKQAVRIQKQLPALFPITMLKKKKEEFKPEITITAPSNAKLRVPLQIKVPYQMVRAPPGDVTSQNDQQ